MILLQSQGAKRADSWEKVEKARSPLQPLEGQYGVTPLENFGNG